MVGNRSLRLFQRSSFKGRHIMSLHDFSDQIARLSLLLIAFTFCSLLAPAERLNVSDLRLTGDAQITQVPLEISLTTNTTWQLGQIDSEIICAKEYEVYFEVDLGALNANQGGGAGVFFYEINANSPDRVQGYEHLVGFNVQDRSRAAYYNYLELYDFTAGATGEWTSTQRYAEVASMQVPFPYGSSGYSQVYFYSNEGRATVTMVNPEGIVSLSDTRTFTPGVPHYFSWLGWTGVARNVHKIRSIDLHVIREDQCDSLYDERTALQNIESQCGSSSNCETLDQYLSCAGEKIKQLSLDNLISFKTRKKLEQHLEETSLLCDGRNLCDLAGEYSRGYEEGLKSLDKQAIKEGAFKIGFDAGVASVNTEAIKQQGYDDGFAAGLNSVDVEAIRESAFDSGVASVDTENVRKVAFQEGVDSVECTTENVGKTTNGENPDTSDSSLRLSADDIQRILDSDCGSCGQANSHGEYVSCSVRALNDLVSLNLITEELRFMLHQENVKSSCGRKDTTPDLDGSDGNYEPDGKNEKMSGLNKAEQGKEELDALKEHVRVLKEVFRQVQSDLSQKKRELRKQQKAFSNQHKRRNGTERGRKEK